MRKRSSNNGNKGTDKSYGKKPNGRKPFSKSEDREMKSSDASAMNDPAWYAANSQLLIDSASLAYSQAIGTYDKSFSGVEAITRINAATGNYTSGKLVAAPGLMTIRLMPTIGISKSNVSTVNIAASRLYSWVRHANSGAKNYDSPDLMMYLLAMDSIYSYYSYIVRAIGVCRLYSQKNRYMSDAVLTALGVIPSSLQDNFAAARNKLNMLGAKMAALCVPKTMPYFMRHAWLYQNIYKDSPTEKSQMYAFVPDGFYKYEGFTDPTGGKLVYQKINATGPSTIDDHLSKLEEMLNAVVADEDINIMSGDILKAYGAGDLIIVGQVPEEFLLLPVYDEEVLSQIQNTTVLPFVKASDITQDASGAILYTPKIDTVTLEANFSNPGLKKITIRKDVVTPADTMVATRLTHPLSDLDPTMTGDDYPISSCGSEIAVMMQLYNLAQAADESIFLARMEVWGFTFTDASASGVSIIVDQCAQLANFDWHPELVIAVLKSEGVYNQMASIFDVDNYTTVTSTELDRMNDTALLSMFNVPAIAPYSSMVK